MIEVKQYAPLTWMKNIQLLLKPDESMTLYVMFSLPTFSFCGGRKPSSVKDSLELSVGTGICQVTIAYDWPGSVGIFSISGGQVILGAWISVNKKVGLKYTLNGNWIRDGVSHVWLEGWFKKKNQRSCQWRGLLYRFFVGDIKQALIG